MRRFLALCLLLAAAPVWGAGEGIALKATDETLILAHGAGRTIQVLARASERLLWSGEGPAEPSLIITSSDGKQAAVVDSAGGTVHLIDTGRSASLLVRTGGSPVAGLFLGRTFLVLLRDDARLTAIGAGGETRSAVVGRDSMFLAADGNDVLVYSRGEGTISRHDGTTLQKKQTLPLAPFASDLETAGGTGYLVVPGIASIIAFSLADLREIERFPIGAVPTDLVLQGANLAVADPASKRIWRAGRSQSFASAFTRGFVRGLLGIGLKPPTHSTFPTGIDRLWSDGSRVVAYDTSSGTLFDVSSSPRKVASGISSTAVDVAGGIVYFWDPAAARIRSVPLRQ